MSWKQFQKWINHTGYRLERATSNHAMLYLPGGYTVFLGPTTVLTASSNLN